MTLHHSLRESLKDALKTKNQARLRTIRGIMTACTNELVATGKTPQDILSDTEVLQVIKRLTKQRKESIVQYEAAHRQDLVAIEQEELQILETYLPQQMSVAEITPIAETMKNTLNITDKSKQGILIGAIMKELGEKADGKDVKAVVEKLFN